MSRTDRFLKRIFDILCAVCGLVTLCPIIFFCWLIAAFETRSNGFFIHRRVGRNGREIGVYKIKTMHNARGGPRSPITAHNVAALTRSGILFRKYKLDELPQLLNVLLGSMSMVGPRPDVPTYADQLKGSDRIILKLRPGITGPASIKYRNEETLLAQTHDAVWLNDTVIWPDKVKINIAYATHYSFAADLKYLIQTFIK